MALGAHHQADGDGDGVGDACVGGPIADRDEDGVDRAFREDVLAGLRHDPKAIPARWFYDAEGSRLFEKITQVEEYYPTRSETEILGARGAEFAELIGPGRAVVEFGSGSSVKTPLLLEAIDPAAYVPLDISGDFLRESAAALGAKFPGLPVHPVEADFMRRVTLPGEVEMTLGQSYPLNPQIKGAIKSLGGVISVEEF